MWKALSRNAASCNAVAIFATGMTLAHGTQAAVTLFDFNDGLQGWSGAGGTLSHRASGGADGGPGDGYLEMFDIRRAAIDPMFAFSGALGSQADKLGGLLTFALFTGAESVPVTGGDFGEVRLYSGTSWVQADDVPNGQPIGTWAQYSIPLLAASWAAGSSGATLSGVLANLTEVRVVLDSRPATNQLETIGLDNVSIAAIPEPHEWAMMLTGLALVGTFARNRRIRATRQP